MRALVCRVVGEGIDRRACVRGQVLSSGQEPELLLWWVMNKIEGSG